MGEEVRGGAGRHPSLKLRAKGHTRVKEEGAKDIVVEIQGKVATLWLNRPERRNALTPAMLDQFEAELERLAGQPAARAVVIRGAGERAFCAGFDITQIPNIGAHEVETARAIANPVERAMSKLVCFPYPTIAMINGAAFGAGLELAICCDLRVASEEAKMGMPPAKLGLVYMPEGLRRFVEVVGVANAKEIFLTGRTYDARRAREMGLVHYAVKKAALESFTQSLALEIAGNAPLALTGLKQVLAKVSSWPMSDEDRKNCEEIVGRCLASEDFQEGRLAFIEKRSPRFTGR